jgi:hypothetical protein
MATPILQAIQSRDWGNTFSTELQLQSITTLENGNILLFPQLPFELQTEENKFLSANYVAAKSKNISFHLATDQLRGANCTDAEYIQLKSMMKRFAFAAENLIHQLFSSYKTALEIGRTSFRPVEISGRVSSYRKDDTRLHVDAFPATPNQGRRILRVFTNINPMQQDRVWRVGESFNDVAARFLPSIKKSWPGKSALLNLLKITKSYRTEYDQIMLQIHDNMKKDLNYQKTVSQSEIRFAPGNTWIVQTDHVSHAAMSGQHLLEQTFYLPVNAMVNPSLSPLRTLEKMQGRILT